MIDDYGHDDFNNLLKYEIEGKFREASLSLESSYDKGYPDAVATMRINKHMDLSKENPFRIQTLTELALRGNDVAEFCVGARYIYGMNVPKDVEKGLYWLDKSVSKNNADACYHLGKYLEKNTFKNYDSTELIRKAAEMKHPLAQNDLARKYLNGTFEYNPSKSLQLYLEAGDNGYWVATRHAAEMYYSGKDIERDFEKAFELYCKAADAGDQESCLMVAEMIENGEGTDKDVSEAIRLYALLAINYSRNGKRFCNEAAYRLGMIFEKGTDVEIDYEDAYYWYSRAAEKGHDKAKKATLRVKNLLK